MKFFRTGLLTLLAALSGAVSIAAFLYGPWLLAAVAKALTTILIIACAWRGRIGDAYGRAILVGLLASLAGDIFLLWPQRGFEPGLFAFLVAHLAYLHAFTNGFRRGFAPAPAAAYALFAGVMLAFLWNKIPDALRLPVAVYVIGLVAMAAAAASMAQREVPRYGAAARSAALGAGLFVLSDLILAFDKFAGPVPLASLWILASYWFAQWLIAASATPPRQEPVEERT
ncbi:MAG: lysoplasmalogenase [Rhodoblastus sp.]